MTETDFTKAFPRKKAKCIYGNEDCPICPPIEADGWETVYHSGRKIGKMVTDSSGNIADWHSASKPTLTKTIDVSWPEPTTGTTVKSEHYHIFSFTKDPTDWERER